ncbi:MAG: hypothetical protein DRR00_27945 [Candidatus Parabeggiatoa sp. nov. 3]|nr:MAG: hypothetical protein DRR00_27945 [Gammaproteobacteria bacterium]RKZ56170.1 MAG: hypothetical protein DRQ99_28940 [Gammaproteobacteria bacterium]
MNTGDILQCLDSILPDRKIIRDIAQQLDDIAQFDEYTRGQVEIEVEDEMRIIVPREASVDIVTKAFYREYFDINYGTGYRVLAALGGIKKIQAGIVYPVYSFIVLYYDSELNLTTVDFHRNMI